MRISEISSPEIPHTTRQMATDHHHDDPNHLHNHILSQIEACVKTIELHSHHKPLSNIIFIDLRACLAQIEKLSPISNAFKLNIWKLGYRIWNACVDISNAISLRSSTCDISPDDQAKLRHIAADLLFVARDVIGVPGPAVKSALFYYKTGLVYHDLKKFDLASVCFERATDLLSKAGSGSGSDSEEKKLVFDVNLARSRTAWEVSDRNLAVALLNRSKGLMSGSAGNRKVLAEQYLAFGKLMLSMNGGEVQALNEALKLMNEALDVCEKGLSTARTLEETVELRGLRIKAIRFIAAVHLQKEEFESAIKCVKVLRESDGGDNHPSLSVLAMKAWLGLGRYGEAEKELRGMAVNKGIPENVWVSAVEAYFTAAGTAGAETAKGVFLGLLGRCHVSAGAAVRVAHRVVCKGGEGLKVRAKVVAELVSDERVAALFVGEAVDKERTAMHAVLWNCAADLFQLKDYEASEELFEKSMLYIPSTVENRTLRAKGFRVLCLCHLAVSQLDRAMEYINEAETLEPNIVCAFLKFKILLQNKDQNGAIAQIEAMPSCLDFTPDYLSLSAHEAIACAALPVAVASLSNLLNFFAAGKSMPTSEVVVIRTLVTILVHEPGNEAQALKFLGHAYNRAIEVGPDVFFGKEEVGRRERNWFAVTSWNFGIRIAKDKKFEESAVFLKLASEFYVFVEGSDTENRVMVCKSLVFSVSASIASEHQKNAALSETEVKQAIELLSKAGKILKAASSGTSDGRLSTFEPDLFFIYTFCAYDLHGRLNDLKSQLLTVKSFASTKACKAQHLLQLGLCASQGPRSNHEVATFCLNACLSSFISSPSTDYRNVALIMRKLISLASIHRGEADDNAVYDMYKQAYRIMVGLKDGEYPAEEGKWLAMTAWNRAAVPVRAAQIEVAKKWMALGIEVAKHVAGMETYKSCMDDFLDGFEKKLRCA